MAFDYEVSMANFGALCISETEPYPIQPVARLYFEPSSKRRYKGVDREFFTIGPDLVTEQEIDCCVEKAKATIERAGADAKKLLARHHKAIAERCHAS
jgi:hypothetical protein